MRRDGMPLRGTLAVIVGAVLIISTAACGGDAEPGATATDAAKGSTFIFASSADPSILDPAYHSDGESSRVTNQIFETLVTTEPGGTGIAPSLAESWEASEDGKTYTFKLHEGVKFHDGDRLQRRGRLRQLRPLVQLHGRPAVATRSPTTGRRCSAASPRTSPTRSARACTAGARPRTTTPWRSSSPPPSASFLSALTLSSFSIASPKALKEYEADKVGGTAEAPPFTGTFGTEHPVGTGPFKFAS